MKQPLAVVTGASTGIGRALAVRLARQGFDLLLLARRADKLAETAAGVGAAGRKAHVRTLDVTRKGAADEALEAAKEIGGLEVLVNNAGFGIYGALAEHDRAETLRMIDTNVRALTDFTAAFLPDLLAKKRGYVLNVASTAGFQPMPFSAAYAATKAYVLSLGEAVSVELKGSGVSLTTLCPGPTESEFFEVGRYKKEEGLVDVPKAVMMSAEKVADAAVRGMLRRKRVVIPGLHNLAGAAAGRHAPRGLLGGVVATVLRPRRGRG